MTSDITIVFQPNWVNCHKFELALESAAASPHSKSVAKVVFVFPQRCKIMIDSGIRLLSFVNQLCHSGKMVTLDFEEGDDGTMGYLGRVGFFDFLNASVNVLPYRPLITGADIYRGYSSALVEIENINPSHRDEELPRKLSETLESYSNFNHQRDKEVIGTAAYTLFAELIDNIFKHSSTELDGFAALQVYQAGRKVMVAVSDSGKGILRTLRPALSKKYPKLGIISDTDLIIEAFNNGLSRFGADQGCGLRQCARQAIKFKAELDVRLPTSRVHLEPSNDGYATAYCYDDLPRIWGTHICFDFYLDK